MAPSIAAAAASSSPLGPKPSQSIIPLPHNSSKQIKSGVLLTSNSTGGPTLRCSAKPKIHVVTFAPQISPESSAEFLKHTVDAPTINPLAVQQDQEKYNNFFRISNGFFVPSTGIDGLDGTAINLVVYEIVVLEAMGFTESEISKITGGKAAMVARFNDILPQPRVRTVDPDHVAIGGLAVNMGPADALRPVAKAIAVSFIRILLSKKVAEYDVSSPEVGDDTAPMHLSAAQFSVELVSDQMELLKEMGYPYSMILMVARRVAFIVDIVTERAAHFNDVLTQGTLVTVDGAAPISNDPISNPPSDSAYGAIGSSAEPSLSIGISGTAHAKVLGDKIQEGAVAKMAAATRGFFSSGSAIRAAGYVVAAIAQ